MRIQLVTFFLNFDFSSIFQKNFLDILTDSLLMKKSIQPMAYIMNLLFLSHAYLYCLLPPQYNLHPKTQIQNNLHINDTA